MNGSSSISVAVRVRPFSEKERACVSSTYNAGPALFNSDPTSAPSHSTPQPPRAQGSGGGALKKALKVLDDRILVFDPPETNAVASFLKSNTPITMGKKVKDIRFCFDRVFDESCGQEEVYEGSAKELVGHVMDGFNSTVFAYGATGCGKTHTISGSNSQPGIIFLIMKDLFSRIASRSQDTEFSLTVSYLEIYNETIRDLLAPEKGPLQLREDTQGAATPSGLSSKQPTSASEVVEWITLGNQNRTVNATEANATSSRSHAVLQVKVSQNGKASGMTEDRSSAVLSVIDLAGSERASVTKNKGDRLIEGANINRSLLALGNCINALCDPKRRGHVPYRDSKLTRLLKQSLGGNCKTVMIVCVSPSSAHYDETHNTLQYANRAKEIKTKAIRNVISVDRHVGEYCRQIMMQSQQIDALKAQLVNQSATSVTEERERDMRSVAFAKSKIMAAWEIARSLYCSGERAKVENATLQGLIDILQRWKEAAFLPLKQDDSLDLSIGPHAERTIALAKSACDNLIVSHVSTSSQLRSAISSSDAAMLAYNSSVENVITSTQASRPTAEHLLSLELEALKYRLEIQGADARALGSLESAKLQARVVHAMCEAQSLAANALKVAATEITESSTALRRLAEGIDNANKDAFELFASIFSSLPSLKRNSGSRSPLDPQAVWASSATKSKAARASLTGFGSAPVGTLASPVRPPAASLFRRQSPRKGVVFQSTRKTAFDSKALSPRKRKEVQWRDETGDGWELEDVKWKSSTSSEESVIEADSSLLNNSPIVMPTLETSLSPLHRAQPVAPKQPTSVMWALTSTNNHSASASAAEMMAASLKQRTSATGSLRHKVLASRSPNLERLSEGNAKAFAFFPDSSEAKLSSASSIATPATRNALTSVENTANINNYKPSFSMAATISGLAAPVVAKAAAGPETPKRLATTRGARRMSSIGPQRSAKPSRRTSFINPPPPLPTTTGASSTTVSGSVVGMVGIAPMMKVTRMGPSSSSAFAPPLSVRKSPRKLGGARRPSVTIGAVGNGPSSMASSGLQPFGLKSAARLSARRESSMAVVHEVNSVPMTVSKASAWR